ncbi:Lsm7p [Saccharomyces cerevisiae YJM1573]|nr:Lsm7p [Saccharomyces cerevisiae YJM1402]AJT33645.1 Lsm7p [Saccharomyces cerevisiae YJM1573]
MHQQHSKSENKPQQQRKKFEGPKREAILDLAKYKDSKIRVKLMGGKLVIGVLKGYDQLMNLVLDDTVEYMSNPDDENNTELISKTARKLGLTVIRGTILVSLSSAEGSDVLYMQK